MRQSLGISGSDVVNVEEAGGGNSRPRSELGSGVARIVGHVPRSVDEDVFGIGSVLWRGVGRVSLDGLGDGHEVGVTGSSVEHAGEAALSSVEVRRRDG